MAEARPSQQSSTQESPKFDPGFDLPSFSSDMSRGDVFSLGTPTSPSFEILGSSDCGNASKKMKTEDFPGGLEYTGGEVHRSISMQEVPLSKRQVTAPHAGMVRSESLKTADEMRERHELMLKELNNLKNLAEASEDEKTKEIFRLRDQIVNMKKECDAKNRRRSTSPENRKLRRSLKVTCTCLSDKLQDIKLTEESDKKRMEAEIVNLRRQLHEVMEANMKWQVYDNQRDHYVAALMEQLEDLKEQLRQSKTNPNLIDSAQREVDKILLTYKDKVTAIEEEKEQLEEELRKFKLLSAGKEQRIQQLEIQLAEQGFHEDTEGVVEALKHQIILCTEDFQAERRDRERAQSKIADLETELQLLRRQLEMYEGEAMHSMSSQRAAALESHAYCSGRTVPDNFDLEEDCDELDSNTVEKQ